MKKCPSNSSRRQQKKVGKARGGDFVMRKSVPVAHALKDVAIPPGEKARGEAKRRPFLHSELNFLPHA